jgi:hypothetical protein
MTPADLLGEIVLLIANHLDDSTRMNALARTNRRVYDLLNKYI